MTITATDMATIQTYVNIGESYDNTPNTYNLGNMGMGPSHDLSVVVTQDGTIVSGAPVVAMSSGTSASCNATLFNYTGTPEITVDSGTDGIALLTGLNACSNYSIYVPARSDADGNLLTTTTAKSYSANIDSQENVFSMDLMEVKRTTGLSQVDSSFLDIAANFNILTVTDTAGNGGTQQVQDNVNLSRAMKTTGDNYLVFNMPVSIADTGGLNMSTRSLLIEPDADTDGAADDGYGDEVEVGATFTLDTTGTILTISPTNAYTAHQVYNITGSVNAMVNGVIDTLAIDFSVIATEDGNTGLAADSAITLDNYNGDTGVATGSTSMTVNTMWLEFPEPVMGSFRLISAVDANQTTTAADDTETLLFGAETPITYASGTLIYTDGTDINTIVQTPSIQVACVQCGTSAGIKYIVPITIAGGVNDEDGDTVTVFIDVMDVEGNRFSDEVILTIE